MNGSVGAGQLPPINVGMSFSDILENLDAGLMGAFEARKGRWGVLLDAIYMKLEGSAHGHAHGRGSDRRYGERERPAGSKADQLRGGSHLPGDGRALAPRRRRRVALHGGRGQRQDRRKPLRPDRDGGGPARRAGRTPMSACACSTRSPSAGRSSACGLVRDRGSVRRCICETC